MYYYKYQLIFLLTERERESGVIVVKQVGDGCCHLLGEINVSRALISDLFLHGNSICMS